MRCKQFHGQLQETLLGTIVLLLLITCLPSSNGADIGGRPEAKSSIVVYVSPWNQQVSSAPTNVSTSASGDVQACSKPSNACPSVAEALDVLQRQRKSRVKATHDRGEAVVRLLASNRTGTEGCRILLTRLSGCGNTRGARAAGCSSRSNFSSSAELGVRIEYLRMARITIDGRNEDDGCVKSVLVPPSINVTNSIPSDYLMAIFKSSALQLSNLEFDDTYVQKPRQRMGAPSGLLHIQQSKFIRIVNCTFSNRYIWQTGASMKKYVVLTNNLFLVLHRCRFNGLPGTEKKAWNTLLGRHDFNSDINEPAVKAELSDARLFHWCDREEIGFITEFFNKMGGDYLAKANSCVRRHRLSNSSCLYLVHEEICPAVLILSWCKFTAVGDFFERSKLRRDFRVINSEDGKVNGLAIAVKVKAFLGAQVSIEDCTVSNNMAPFGSTVMLHITDCDKKATTRQANVNITIKRSTFTSNSGLYGGALMIRFDQMSCRKPLRNMVKLDSCTFEGNGASKEGGAVVVRNLSPADVLNCVHMVNVSFSSNSAGMFKARQPGGALSITGSTPAGPFDRSPTGTYQVNESTFCTKSVVITRVFLESTTFTDNDGVGCVNVKQANVLFSHSRSGKFILFRSLFANGEIVCSTDT